MIARVWSARATVAGAPAYAEHLRSHVLPAVRAIEGYAGARLLQREDAGSVELTVITYWRSFDAIRAFAGASPEEAVVAEEAIAMLVDFDRRVRHHEVVVEDEAPR